MKRTVIGIAATAMLATVFGTGGEPPASAGEPDYDVILRHGTVIDGTGAPRYVADVGIRDGRIAEIGDLDGESAAIERDVRGLYVTPGFINIHSHAEIEGVSTAENMLTQGVTTEIINADGAGPLGLTKQLRRFAGRGLAVNIGGHVGFNSVWQDVMGATDHRPSADQVRAMRRLVSKGMRAGAWGVSAGLDYVPGRYATTGEAAKVVAAARRWRTNFPNHDRLTEENGYSSIAGATETIDIGTAAGVAPVVTHMKVQGWEQGKAAEILGRMTSATRQGTYTAADVYPYLAGQTSLAALLIPQWAQDGGFDAMLKRFKDPQLRARIVKETEHTMGLRFGGPSGVFFMPTRQELVDVMEELNVSAGEAVVRILEEHGNGSTILRFGAERDLVDILQHPTAAVACDCGASKQTNVHPRYYGTFPRVLGHYVRGTHALTWEDAVRKMTGLPATMLGMVDRGVLAAGTAADVTVFNPKTVADHATYEDPTIESDGVRHVFVNGQPALLDGSATDRQAGDTLVRSADLPTRAMSTDAPRSIRAVGVARRGSAARIVRIDVRQRRSDRAAHGHLVVIDPGTGRVITATDLGILQTTDRWAGFTARSGSLLGHDSPLTVTVDRASPIAPDDRWQVSIELDGHRFVGSLTGAAHVATSE